MQAVSVGFFFVLCLHGSDSSPRSVSGNEIHSRSSGPLQITGSAIIMNGSHSVSDSTVAIAVLRSLIILNSTQLQCPEGNTVYAGRNVFGCEYCPPKTYLLGAGVWIDPPSLAAQYTPCLGCPYGSECEGGSSVFISSGYWALQVEDGSIRSGSEHPSYFFLTCSSVSLLTLFLRSVSACPDGYCCLGQSSCRWHEVCASTNRDGILCGLFILSGFSTHEVSLLVYSR
jgi:hypothetical protein